MLEILPQFWQGVLASILAAIIIAMSTKAWAISSSQSKKSRERSEAHLQDLKCKLQSRDSVLRVEGYFEVLFTLLKYLFYGSIVWVVAWSFSFVLSESFLSIALLSLVPYYLGLRWLSRTMNPPRKDPTFQASRALVIRSAKYGANDQYVDVTQNLENKVQDGLLSVNVDNNIAGDPCPGVTKTLEVQYVYGNSHHIRSVGEGRILNLP